jgi:hypothetical protein
MTLGVSLLVAFIKVILMAKYYVTEDKMTLKKSRLVASLLFPNLKILGMKDFQHKFC